MKRSLVVIAVAFAVAFGFSVAMQAQEKAPTIVILKGNPMGGVKFNHTEHVKAADNKCETCHHASKAEKPMKGKEENCQDCHTKTATAPMKTTAKLAFHDAMAKKGICIDCHVQKAAAGVKGTPAPGKCSDCHKKENV
jgi:cytochrome c5